MPIFIAGSFIRLLLVCMTGDVFTDFSHLGPYELAQVPARAWGSMRKKVGVTEKIGKVSIRSFVKQPRQGDIGEFLQFIRDEQKENLEKGLTPSLLERLRVLVHHPAILGTPLQSVLFEAIGDLQRGYSDQELFDAVGAIAERYRIKRGSEAGMALAFALAPNQHEPGRDEGPTPRADSGTTDHSLFVEHAAGALVAINLGNWLVAQTTAGNLFAFSTGQWIGSGLTLVGVTGLFTMWAWALLHRDTVRREHRRNEGNEAFQILFRAMGERGKPFDPKYSTAHTELKTEETDQKKSGFENDGPTRRDMLGAFIGMLGLSVLLGGRAAAQTQKANQKSKAATGLTSILEPKTFRRFAGHVEELWRNHMFIRSNNGDGNLQNWAFLYDNAIAAQIFLSENTREGLARSVRLLGNIQKNWHRRKDVFASDNANGNARAIPAFVSAVDADTGMPAENVGEWKVDSGPILHVGMAAINALYVAGRLDLPGYKAGKYKNLVALAEEVADYALTLQGANKGVRHGPWGKAHDPKDQHFGNDAQAPSLALTYTQEHQPEAYFVWKAMAVIGSPEKRPLYRKAAEDIKVFDFKKFWDGKAHRFHGALSEEDELSEKLPSDVDGWALSMYGVEELIEKIGLEQTALMFQKLDEDHAVKNNAGNIVGYDFTSDRRQFASPEWTAQVAAAKLQFAVYLRSPANAAQAKRIRTPWNAYAGAAVQLLRRIEALKPGETQGVPYAIDANGNPAERVDTMLGFQTQAGEALIGWYFLAVARGYDPAALDGGKLRTELKALLADLKPEDYELKPEQEKIEEPNQAEADGTDLLENIRMGVYPTPGNQQEEAAAQGAKSFYFEGPFEFKKGSYEVRFTLSRAKRMGLQLLPQGSRPGTEINVMEINGKKGLNVVRVPIDRNFTADQVVFFVGSQKFGIPMSGAALQEDEMTDISLRKIGVIEKPATKKSRGSGKRTDNSARNPLIKVASLSVLRMFLFSIAAVLGFHVTAAAQALRPVAAQQQAQAQTAPSLRPTAYTENLEAMAKKFHATADEGERLLIARGIFDQLHLVGENKLGVHDLEIIYRAMGEHLLHPASMPSDWIVNWFSVLRDVDSRGWRAAEAAYMQARPAVFEHLLKIAENANAPIFERNDALMGAQEALPDGIEAWRRWDSAQQLITLGVVTWIQEHPNAPSVEKIKVIHTLQDQRTLSIETRHRMLEALIRISSDSKLDVQTLDVVAYRIANLLDFGRGNERMSSDYVRNGFVALIDMLRNPALRTRAAEEMDQLHAAGGGTVPFFGIMESLVDHPALHDVFIVKASEIAEIAGAAATAKQHELATTLFSWIVGLRSEKALKAQVQTLQKLAESKNHLLLDALQSVLLTLLEVSPTEYEAQVSKIIEASNLPNAEKIIARDFLVTVKAHGAVRTWLRKGLVRMGVDEKALRPKEPVWTSSVGRAATDAEKKIPAANINRSENEAVVPEQAKISELARAFVNAGSKEKESALRALMAKLPAGKKLSWIGPDAATVLLDLLMDPAQKIPLPLRLEIHDALSDSTGPNITGFSHDRRATRDVLKGWGRLPKDTPVENESYVKRLLPEIHETALRLRQATEGTPEFNEIDNILRFISNAHAFRNELYLETPLRLVQDRGTSSDVFLLAVRTLWPPSYGNDLSIPNPWDTSVAFAVTRAVDADDADRVAAYLRIVDGAILARTADERLSLAARFKAFKAVRFAMSTIETGMPGRFPVRLLTDVQDETRRDTDLALSVLFARQDLRLMNMANEILAVTELPNLPDAERIALRGTLIAALQMQFQEATKAGLREPFQKLLQLVQANNHLKLLTHDDFGRIGVDAFRLGSPADQADLEAEIKNAPAKADLEQHKPANRGDLNKWEFKPRNQQFRSRVQLHVALHSANISRGSRPWRRLFAMATLALSIGGSVHAQTVPAANRPSAVAQVNVEPLISQLSSNSLFAFLSNDLISIAVVGLTVVAVAVILILLFRPSEHDSSYKVKIKRGNKSEPPPPGLASAPAIGSTRFQLDDSRLSSLALQISQAQNQNMPIIRIRGTAEGQEHEVEINRLNKDERSLTLETKLALARLIQLFQNDRRTCGYNQIN